MSTILVLSANSKVGAEAVLQLAEAGHAVRAGVRNPAKYSGPGIAVSADLDRPETLAAALEGVDAALLTTSADANQHTQHVNFIRAAKAAGVRHVVRVSVVGADLGSPLFLLRSNAETERELEQSGLAWTHLRPHSFMENFLGQVGAMRSMGKVFSNSGDAAIPFVSVQDIAATAVGALTTPGHDAKTYIVTGPRALTHYQVAAHFSAVLGQPIEYINIPEEAAAQAMAGAGMPEWLANDLAALNMILQAGKHLEVTTTVPDLTGRPATLFDDFVARHHGNIVPS